MSISLCLFSDIIVELIHSWKIINDVDLNSDFLIVRSTTKSISDGVLRSFDPLECGADGLYILEPSVLASIHHILVEEEEPAEGFLVSGDGNFLAMYIGSEDTKTMD